MSQSPISNLQLRITNYVSRSPKLGDLGAIALIAALVLLFFWRIWTPRLEDRAAFPPGDFTDQFWMFRVYTARAFAAGHLPLWSENFNSGHPFLADVQSAIFYPISLIWTGIVVALRGASFSLFDLELEAIFHFILAGAFTYLFARRVLNSRVAAFVSAITFTFGGYLTAYPPLQLAILETATWLPLILLFIHLAQYRGGAYYFAAGIALGVAALAGHPQTFLIVLYAAAIYFFWESRNHVKGIRHYVLRFIIVLFIAAGVSAAQWLPTLEYQLVSTRAAIGWAEAARGFPTIDPLQMILPGYTSAFQSPLYLGILPLWLALFALCANFSREKKLWGMMALGSLLLSFGFYVFAYALFYLFAPGFAMFRGQERLAFVVSFSLAMLAGYGMRDLLNANFPARVLRRAWALLPAGLIVTALMLFAFYIGGAQKASPRLAFLLDRAGLMALLFLLTSAVIGAWIARPAAENRGRGWGLLALILFDLFSINAQGFNAPTTPRFPESPLIQTIHADGDRSVFRVVDEGKLPGHFGIAYRLEEIGGISPLRVARYNDLLDQLPEEKLWNLLGVRYVITGRPSFKDAEVIANDGDTRLLRLNGLMPRAWFAASAIQNADDAAVLAAMQSDAFDPRTVAYIAELSPIPSPIKGGGQVMDFQRVDPEHSRIIVNAAVDGLLIISQVYYPGWRATVDGIETPILRADLALSAVPVRAGAQRVELVYDPWTVKVGVGISALSALFVISAITASRRTRTASRS